MSTASYVHPDVVRAASLIDSLLNIVDSEKWLGEEPESGSLWDATSTLPGADTAKAVSDFRALGLIDQMRGLVGVMGTRSLYSGFTMARPVCEGAAYGLWIWDTNISPEERVCRCLLEMKHDAIKERDFWGSLKGKQTSLATQSEIATIYDDQNREVDRFKDKISTLRQRTSEQLATERPTSGLMIAQVNERLTGLVNHRLLFRLTSGVVHQSTTSLVDLLIWNEEHQINSMKVIEYLGPIYAATVFFDNAMTSLAECYGKVYPESDATPIKLALNDLKAKHINSKTFVDLPDS